MITDGRIAEILERLNNYTYGGRRGTRPAVLGVWMHEINNRLLLPEYDENATVDLGGDYDRFALTDGTVFRWDASTREWEAQRTS